MPVTDRTLALMRRLVIDLQRVTTSTDRALLGAYVDAWDAVVDQLRDALLDVLAQDGAITQTRLQRSSRIASALQAIADSLDRLSGTTAAIITDQAGQVTSIAVTAQAAIAGSQLPAAGFPLLAVNPDIVDTIVARTAQQITARTRPLAQAGIEAINRELVRGAAAADNPVKVARAMVKRARYGGVDLPAARAMTIARTELNDAARTAQQTWDQANRTTLQGWEWLSARDVTTCPACWAMDGTLHELDEPGPIGHPNCRCTRMVRTKTWRELGLDLDEDPEDLRMSAEDHFRSLTRDEQRQIMGPARLQALDQGAAWSSLAQVRPNADWRPSMQVTPVRDLRVPSAV